MCYQPLSLKYLLLFCLVILLFNACKKVPQSFNIFVPLTFQDSTLQQEIQQLMPEKPSAILLQHWGFAIGDPKQGLNVSPAAIPSPNSSVLIPHRINIPDTPLWYFKRIQLDKPQLLLVDADDGAQVYYGGKRVKQYLPNCFQLDATADSMDLVIRILNNALEGGLRKAELINLEEGIDYFNQVATLEMTAGQNITANMIYAEPFVQRVALGKYTIKIVADGNTRLKLSYGMQPKQLTKTIAHQEQVVGIFTFFLSDLTPDTTYYFQIQQPPFYSKLFAFRTENTKLPFAFTAWGDSQGGWKIFQTLVQDMVQKLPAFSIGLGDLVADGSAPSQWLGFLYALQPLSSNIPIFTILGNHDYDGYYDNLIPMLYQQHIRLDNYFAWTYNNCYFIALDPNERFPIGIEGKQCEWFFEQIASEAWKNSQWRFVLLHQPPYSQGWKGYHGDEFVRQLIDQNAASAKIDFVLSGHSHCYERWSKYYGQQKTHFLILGGAGGGLENTESSAYPKMDTVIKAHHYGYFKVDKEGIDFEVIGLKGEVLEKIRFTK
jgi:predicted phosphodiesterase